jgi:hypothetical protein
MVKILKIKKSVAVQEPPTAAPVAAPVPVAVATPVPVQKKILKLKKTTAIEVAQEPSNPVCCLCSKNCECSYGNSPHPLATEGVCCNECNQKVVIARLQASVAVAAPKPKPVATVQKKVLKLKKVTKTPCPPPPPAGSYLSPAAEAFEAVRLYCEGLGIDVPEEEIKHYYAELEREKKEYTEFWSQHGCSVTMAVLLAAANGEDLDIAQAKAKLVEKKKVITEDSIGEMPAYGTPEFWAWCRRRKELRLQKEAAIIAAGGTVPPQKVKGGGSKVQKKEAAP